MSATVQTSTVPAELDWDRDDRADALRALSDTRRRNRVANLNKFDAFYKAYVSGIFGIIIVYGLSGWLGTSPITDAQKADFVDLYPSYIAVAIALAFAVGLRSGGRGGPLALERATVRHVMLAPVAREDILRSAARRSLFHAAFIGAVIGGALGMIAARRLPGPAIQWVAVFLIFGVVVGAGATAIALTGSGIRIRSWVADVIAVLFIGWAAADAVWNLATSPFSWIAHILTWPFEFDPFSLVAIALVIAAVIAGLYFAPGWSLEVAERRSRLVGQLRFAATMQDVRTVMVLQRQLAQETMRAKPRLRIRARNAKKLLDAKGQPKLGVLIARQLQSLMRWPAVRLVRPVIFSGIAGAAAFAGWQVSPAFFVVSALLMWLVALDFVEPIAQESDHPDRIALTRHERGWVYLRLLVVPILMQIVAVLLMVVTAGALFSIAGAKVEDFAPFMISSFSLSVILPLAGAALVVSRPAGGPGVASITPEITGLVMLWRAGFPPLLAVGAFVPLMYSQRKFVATGDLSESLLASSTAWNIAFAVGLVSLAWIRVSEQWGNQLRQATDEQKNSMSEGSKSGSKAGQKAGAVTSGGDKK